jgi:predicted RND superfamily exporter protein
VSQQSEPPPIFGVEAPKALRKVVFADHLQAGVAGFFATLARFSVHRPITSLLAVLAAVLLSMPGLLRLRLNTDGHALVTPTAPEVIFDQQIRAKFGIEDQIVILIQSDTSVLNTNTIQLVRDLTSQCLQLPGVPAEHVMSLATEPSFRMKPGTLIHETLLEPPLKTDAELNQLREDLRRIELYTSTVISPDEKATVILVGVPPDADRAKLYEQVQGIIRPKKNRPEKIAISGAPVAESLLGIHILEDLGVPKALLGTSTRAGQPDSISKAPRNLHELRLFVARKIGLVPIAIVIMMLIFLISFRSIVAMLLPLPGVGASILFTFGLMGWCGVPVYLTIAVMPVLLTATGVTNDIYLFSRYFSMLRGRSKDGRRQILCDAFATMAVPVAATSLTAAIGFFSFAFSPLTPVRAFGIFTGVGVLFGLLFSFTAVPAMLSLLSARSAGVLARSNLRTDRGDRVSAALGSSSVAAVENASTPLLCGQWLAAFADWTIRRRWWIAGLLALTMALTPLGLRKLQVQDSWTDAFDPDSEFRRATKTVNDEFHGMHLLFVSFDIPATFHGELPGSAITKDGLLIPTNLISQPGLIAGSPIVIKHGAEWRSHIEMVSVVGSNIAARIPQQDIPSSTWAEFSTANKINVEIPIRSQLRPEIVRETAALGSFLRERKQYAVGGVLSPFDYLSTTRFMARPNDPQARLLPNDPGEIKLMWDYYGLARGRERLHQIVDSNYWQSLTTLFLKDANFVDTARLMSDVRDYEREHLAPKGIKLGFAGDVALSQSLIRGIVGTQLHSLCWSLLGIFLVTSLLGRSWRWGFYCVLPSTLAIVVKFAIMGWTGIPLGVATSMFAAMTLGIAANCAIQFLGAYDLHRSDGVSPNAAITGAMTLSGPAAIINTLAVSMGFGVLMLSQVPANARLGFLVVLGLVGCLIATFLMLPILLRMWPVKRDRDA